MPSFEAIYQQYFAFVWAMVRRLGVANEAMDDVVQEVFIVIHSKLHSLQQPDALRSWIYGVVRRTVSSHHRSNRTRQASTSTFAASANVPFGPPTPHELTQRAREFELLSSLLAELDEPKREVFSLVELQELSVPEVAELLEIPLNTAYSRLRAARIAFEEALARHTLREEGPAQS